jgi:hypothetical protein
MDKMLRNRTVIKDSQKPAISIMEEEAIGMATQVVVVIEMGMEEEGIIRTVITTTETMEGGTWEAVEDTWVVVDTWVVDIDSYTLRWTLDLFTFF